MTVIPLNREAEQAEQVAPPRSSTPRYPLGWLRGLAALCVVFFHAYQHNRDPETWAWPFSGAAHQAMLGTDLFVHAPADPCGRAVLEERALALRAVDAQVGARAGGLRRGRTGGAGRDRGEEHTGQRSVHGAGPR